MTHPQSLVLRTAQPRDAAAACRVVRQSIVQCCGEGHRHKAPLIAAWLDNKTASNFARWLATAENIAVIAERGGKAVGFGMCSSDGHIRLCHVVPDVRFNGVGSEMLACMAAKLHALGVQDLRLESTRTAEAFYRRRGFVPDGPSVVAFGLPAQPMRKRLTAMDAVTIEHAYPTDAPSISALVSALSQPFLISPTGAGAEPFFASIGKAATERHLWASNFHYLKAVVADQLVGVVAVRDQRHLFHLFVAESFQRQGLGRRLWNSVARHAIRFDHPNGVTVNASLQAVPFYERLGFVATGTVVHADGVAFQPMRMPANDRVRDGRRD